MNIEEIKENLELFDEKTEKLEYIIGLGKKLGPLPLEEKNEVNRVQGCVSNVWLVADSNEESPPKVTFRMDSDSQIVKGVAAILITVYSGRTPDEILAVDIEGVFDRLALKSYISSQRQNGLYGMIEKIRREAIRLKV